MIPKPSYVLEIIKKRGIERRKREEELALARLHRQSPTRQLSIIQPNLNGFPRQMQPHQSDSASSHFSTDEDISKARSV